MNNEAIQRLREPAAWVLLGSVAAKMLAMVISALTSGSASMGGVDGPSGADAFFGLVSDGAAFLSVSTIIVLLAAVLLMVTAKEKSPRTFGAVLMALILLGIGAFFAVINLITGFFTGLGFGPGMSNFIGTAADLAVAGIVGFGLYKVFTDPTLVPRAQAQAQQQFGYGPPAGGQQPYPPHTGAQQSFAPPQGAPPTGGQQPFAPQPDPNMTGMAHQQPYTPQPDPNVTGMAHQQPYTPQPDPAITGQGQQPYEAQPWQQGGEQPAYQQSPYPQQASPYDQQYQQGYQDPGAASAPSGGQPTYDWSGQPVQQQPYGGQQYDAYSA